MSRKSYRTPLARARSLGSARHGTEAWGKLRLTALALVPLALYFIVAFFANAVFKGGYAASVEWLRSPLTATLMIMTVAAGFHHAASGLHEVIEDYIHIEGLKLFLQLFVKFAAAFLGLAGVLSVLKILLIGA